MPGKRQKSQKGSSRSSKSRKQAKGGGNGGKGSSNKSGDHLLHDTIDGNGKTKGPFFRQTSRNQQRHRQPLYCVCWNSDVHVDDEGSKYQYFATCGAGQLTIYVVEVDNPKRSFGTVQTYKDEDKEEHFYACAYGGRSRYWGSKVSFVDDEDDQSPSTTATATTVASTATSSGSIESLPTSTSAKTEDSEVKETVTLLLEPETQNAQNYMTTIGNGSCPLGPQLLCVAGAGAIIKVVDPVQRKQIHTLNGHGSDIYDLKVSPSDEFLLLSASVDESVRMWNLHSFACVAIFAGHHGHREAILSVSWHPTGRRFASSGMDKSIRLWEVGKSRVSEAVKASQKMSHADDRLAFHPLCEQFPYFATYKAHVNFVDCVQFLGDMILSKSTYNTIMLWLPNITKSASMDKLDDSAAYSPPNDIIVLRTFELDHCNIWFVRFAADSLGTQLAVGNIKGEVDVWDIDSCKKRASQRLKPTAAGTVRTLAFSPSGKTLITCTDSGSVCKWDNFG